MADNTSTFNVDVGLKIVGTDGAVREVRRIVGSVVELKSFINEIKGFDNHLVNGSGKRNIKEMLEPLEKMNKELTDLNIKGANLARIYGKKFNIVATKTNSGVSDITFERSAGGRAPGSSKTTTTLMDDTREHMLRQAKVLFSNVTKTFNSVGLGTSAYADEAKNAIKQHYKQSVAQLGKLYNNTDNPFGKKQATKVLDQYKSVGSVLLNGKTVGGMSGIAKQSAHVVAETIKKNDELRASEVRKSEALKSAMSKLEQQFTKLGMSTANISAMRSKLQDQMLMHYTARKADVRNPAISSKRFVSDNITTATGINNAIRTAIAQFKSELGTKKKDNADAQRTANQAGTQKLGKKEMLADSVNQMNILQKKAFEDMRAKLQSQGMSTVGLGFSQKAIESKIGKMQAGATPSANDSNTSMREFSRQIKIKLAELRASMDATFSSANQAYKTEMARKKQVVSNQKKLDDMQIADDKAQDSKRRSVNKSMESLLNGKIQGLRTENIHQNRGQRAVAEAQIKEYNKILADFRTSMAGIRAPNAKELQQSLDSLEKRIKDSVGNLDVVTAKKMVRKGNPTWGSPQMQSSLAGIGGVTLESGRKMENAIKQLPYQKIGQTFTGFLQSALYASWSTVFSNMTSVVGSLAEVAIMAIVSPIKSIMAGVAGVIKGIGIFLMRGVLTAIMSSMSAIGGLLTASLTFGLGAIVVAGYTIITLITDLMNTISNILKSVFDAVAGIINAGISIITMTVKSAFDIFSNILKGLFEGLKGVVNGFIEFSKQAFSALIDIGKQGLKEFSDAQLMAAQAFKETIPIVGESISAYQRLMRGIRSNFGLDMKDVGAGIFDIVSSGFRNFGQASDIANASAKLSIASTSSMATAVRAVVVAYQNYKDKGETIATITNTLAKASTLGAMNMEELGGSMRMIVGLSSRVGMSFNDTMMSLSYMTRTFGRGSIQAASQYLSRFIEAISMPTNPARRKLQQLGVSFTELGKNGKNSLADIAGLSKQLAKLQFKDIRGIFTRVQDRRAWLALTKDINGMDNILKESAEMGADNITKQFDVVMSTASKTMDRFKQSMSVGFEYVGNMVWSLFGGSLQKATDLVVGLINTVNSDNGISTFFEALQSWFKPISEAVFAPLINTLEYLKKFAGGARGFDWKAYFNSEALVEIREGILNFIENVKQTFISLYEWLTDPFKKLESYLNEEFQSTLKDIWKWLSAPDFSTWISSFQAVKREVVTIAQTIWDIVSNSSRLGDIFRVVFDVMVAYAKPAFTMLKGIAISTFYEIGIAIGNTLYEAIVNGLIRIIPAIEGALSSLPEKIKGYLGINDNTFDGVKKFLHNQANGQITDVETNDKSNRYVNYEKIKKYTTFEKGGWGIEDDPNTKMTGMQAIRRRAISEMQTDEQAVSSGGVKFENLVQQKINEIIDKDFSSFVGNKGGGLTGKDSINSLQKQTALDGMIKNGGLQSIVNNENALRTGASQIGNFDYTTTKIGKDKNMVFDKSETINMTRLVDDLLNATKTFQENPDSETAYKKWITVAEKADTVFGILQQIQSGRGSSYGKSPEEIENLQEGTKNLTRVNSEIRNKKQTDEWKKKSNEARAEASSKSSAELTQANNSFFGFNDKNGNKVSGAKDRLQEMFTGRLQENKDSYDTSHGRTSWETPVNRNTLNDKQQTTLDDIEKNTSVTAVGMTKFGTVVVDGKKVGSGDTSRTFIRADGSRGRTEILSPRQIEAQKAEAIAQQKEEGLEAKGREVRKAEAKLPPASTPEKKKNTGITELTDEELYEKEQKEGKVGVVARSGDTTTLADVVSAINVLAMKIQPIEIMVNQSKDNAINVDWNGGVNRKTYSSQRASINNVNMPA